MSLILHCGAERVTREQVEAVPVPDHTRSHKPVPYKDAIALLHHEASRLGTPVNDEAYGLNKKGDQLFAMLTLDTDEDERDLSIGLRQSYNKTLSLGVAVGSRVFVCDNLCFSGDAFKVVRKNTTRVWNDFRRMLRMQVDDSLRHYEALSREIAAMKGAPMPLDRGYEALGLAMGRGLLTPTQATVAFGDWTEPRHAEFAERNVWSLYNAMTEGLKKGPPGRIPERHSAAHAFTMGEIVAAPSPTAIQA